MKLTRYIIGTFGSIINSKFAPEPSNKPTFLEKFFNQLTTSMSPTITTINNNKLFTAALIRIIFLPHPYLATFHLQ